MRAVDALEKATTIVVPPSWTSLSAGTRGIFDKVADRLAQAAAAAGSKDGFDRGLAAGEKKGYDLGIAAGEKKGFALGFAEGKAEGASSLPPEQVVVQEVVRGEPVADVGLIVYVNCGPSYTSGLGTVELGSYAAPLPLDILAAPHLRDDDGHRRSVGQVTESFQAMIDREGGLLFNGRSVQALRAGSGELDLAVMPLLEDRIARDGGLVIRS